MSSASLSSGVDGGPSIYGFKSIKSFSARAFAAFHSLLSSALRDAYIVRDHALAQMQGFIQKGAKEAFEQIDAYKKAVDKRKKLDEMWRAYETAKAQKACA
jgi:hypothetical protein